jgi:hypothetical protein
MMAMMVVVVVMCGRNDRVESSRHCARDCRASAHEVYLAIYLTDCVRSLTLPNTDLLLQHFTQFHLR